MEKLTKLLLVQSLKKFGWQLEAVQVRDLPFHKSKWRYLRTWNIGNFLSVAELVAGDIFNGLHIVRKSLLGIAMQILHTLATPERRQFWRWVRRRRRTKKGKKNLKSFHYRAELVETNMQSWGDDDARLSKSDTALRKSLVSNISQTQKIQLDGKTHDKQEEIEELQTVKEFLQISVLTKGK